MNSKKRKRENSKKRKRENSKKRKRETDGVTESMRQIEKFAVQQLKKWGLTDWCFKWDTAFRRYGICRYHKLEIGLSKRMTILINQSTKDIGAHAYSFILCCVQRPAVPYGGPLDQGTRFYVLDLMRWGGVMWHSYLFFFFFKRGFSECSKAPDSVQHISEKK